MPERRRAERESESDPLGAAVARVMAHVHDAALRSAACGLVDIASPTGRERELATWIVDRLISSGVEAALQPIDATQANAVGRLGKGAGGASVLLYAPIDTFTTGVEDGDVPWVAETLREDMRPRAHVLGDLVHGLGAGNPKGHAACVLVAMEAMAASGVELPGEIVAGFGAGGMPTFAVDESEARANTGHGVGAGFLVERGFTTDFAVIAKPGWNVSHEEVGLVWVDVLVHGIHTYVGSRHRLPYRNPIVMAGEVAIRLERWLAEYAERHELATMKPQGVIGSVAGGWERMVAATPALVRLRLDLRMTTAQTAPEVVREVRFEVDRIGRELDLDLGVEQIASIPASHTSPTSPVVRAAVAAWEAVTAETHVPTRQNSGATDANILRMRGVPTARIGMPKLVVGPDGGPVDFSLGMNLVDVRAMRRLVEVLVRTVLGMPAL